jgi:hypothetical protein
LTVAKGSASGSRLPVDCSITDPLTPFDRVVFALLETETRRRSPCRISQDPELKRFECNDVDKKILIVAWKFDENQEEWSKWQ